ncbi:MULTISPECIES: hypothetical protein [unclassified Burkholderia]|uniref:hypothetical protein n=1 Tax=unclassified Burkholderia TaxID=2613784 RepID=UPI000B1C98E0|nr:MULTISPECIES: hypothetical protein [unclassified Burkholderia]TGN98600.1 hypothetical protein PL79_006075 [Burkholderia sp. USMB20]
MSHKHSTEQDAKLLYPNYSLECVLLDGETIFYSETKNSYFGLSGVAVDILTISRRLHTGLRAEDFINEIAGSRALTTTDKKLILDGVTTLIDLGALYEK